MNLVKNFSTAEPKRSWSRAESIIQLVADKGDLNLAGIVTYRFETANLRYRLKIIEGDFIKPFLMLEVINDDKQRHAKEMIDQSFIDVANIIKIFRMLKNEVG